MLLYELKLDGRFIQIVCDTHNRSRKEIIKELIDDGYPANINLVYYKKL